MAPCPALSRVANFAQSLDANDAQLQRDGRPCAITGIRSIIHTQHRTVCHERVASLIPQSPLIRLKIANKYFIPVPSPLNTSGDVRLVYRSTVNRLTSRHSSRFEFTPERLIRALSSLFTGPDLSRQEFQRPAAGRPLVAFLHFCVDYGFKVIKLCTCCFMRIFYASLY